MLHLASAQNLKDGSYMESRASFGFGERYYILAQWLVGLLLLYSRESFSTITLLTARTLETQEIFANASP